MPENLQKKDLSKINSQIITNLSVYSVSHALVDAACGAVLFGGVSQNKLTVEYFAFLVALYNVLAFALQPAFGAVVDNLRRPGETAAAGCMLVTLSVFAYRFPLLAVCTAGIGNALFHIGGGVIALNLRPQKAAMPGVYVAPGAIGLLLGMLIGKNGYFVSWHFAAALAAAIIVILIIKKPAINYSTERSITYNRFGVILFLILSSVAIRALVGFMLNYPWKANTTLLIIFTLAVVMGKAMGGILADRFGWMYVTAAGLLISAFLLSFSGNYPLSAVLGVFLFNLTMPVTLTAVSNMYPGRPGYAFGLTTLALIIGSFPSFTGLRKVIYSNNKWMVFGTVLIMSFLLYKGLKLYEESRIHAFESSGETYSRE